LWIFPWQPPYMQLEGAGYLDAWTLPPGKKESFTCCQDDDLLNKKSALYERIDVIFSSELPDKVKAKVVGNKKKDKKRDLYLWDTYKLPIIRLSMGQAKKAHSAKEIVQEAYDKWLWSAEERFKEKEESMPWL